MQATFYKFSKNTDSTAQPSGGSSKNVRLKESTSLLDPVLILDRFTFDHTWNYVSIPEFSRFYFITDVVYDGAVVNVKCSVDVLASWKTEVGNSTQYVIRSASQYDGNVLDRLYPVKTGCTEVVARDGAFPSLDNGVFIIGVTSVEAIAGSVCYYACESDTFAYICSRLMNYIVNQTGWNEDWIPWAFQNALIDPLSKIVSCKWFPYSYSTISGNSQNYIYAGDWVISDANISVKRISKTDLAEGGYVNKHFLISAHPQASARGAYMNTSPFTRSELIWNPFGVIPIDPNLYKGDPYLLVTMHFDFATGQGSLEVATTSTAQSIVPTKQRIAFVHGSVGVDVMLTQAVTNLIQGVGNMITSGLSDIMLKGDFMGLMGCVESADSFLHPQMMSNGQNGNFSAYSTSNTPMFIQRFFSAVDDDNTHKGRPLMQLKKINTLSGFTQCDHVELDIPATSAEHDQLKTMMERGFYYD